MDLDSRCGFDSGILYRLRLPQKVAEREISSAEEEAKRIINESIKVRRARREKLSAGKGRNTQSRSEYEREVKERRAELTKQERRRYQQKEENLDRKLDAVEKKNDVLSSKIAAVEAQQQEVALVKKSQLEMLEKISGFTVEEAKII